MSYVLIVYSLGYTYKHEDIDERDFMQRDNDQRNARCSFCGRSVISDNIRLIEGQSVIGQDGETHATYICRDCVLLCIQMVKEEDA